MKPVIQMRVEIEEKAQLLAEAKAEGVSLSDLLRRRCLRNGSPKVSVAPPPVEASPAIQEQAMRGTGKTMRGVVSDLAHFQQRVNFFKYHEGMTTKRAEDAARREAA